MRIKTVAAPNIKTALKVVRSTLGDDAVILSNRKVANGVEVMASYVPRKPVEQKPVISAPPQPNVARMLTASENKLIKDLCRHHRIPFALRNRWAQLTSGGTILDSLKQLVPINNTWLKQLGEQDSLIFVGPPGSGKTSTIAKLAVQLHVHQMPLQMMSLDVIKAGGYQQLQQYMQGISLPTMAIESLDDLDEAQDIPGIKLIDMPSVNAFDQDDMQFAQAAISSSGATPILVLPASIDCMTTAELCRSYTKLGIRGIIFTQLDTTRRYGSLLAAPASSQIPLIGLSHSPMIAEHLYLPTHKYMLQVLQASI